MSVSFYASLAVGVEIESRYNYTSTTRFDELTGEPYQKIETEALSYIKGTDILVVSIEEDENGLDFAGGCSKDTLSIIGGEIVGAVIGSISKEVYVESFGVSLESISLSVTDVADKLKQKFGYEGEVEVFVIKKIFC